MTRPGVGRRWRPASAQGELRLLVGVFAVTLALTLLAAALVAEGIGDAARTRAAVDRVDRSVQSLHEAYAVQMSASSGYVIGGPAHLLERVDEGRAAELEELARLRLDLADHPAALTALDVTETVAQEWRELAAAQVSARRTGGSTDAVAWTGVLAAYDRVVDAVEQLRVGTSAREDALMAEVRAEQRSALYLLIASLAVSVAALVLLVRRFSAVVVQPLARLAEDAAAVAGGDVGRALRVGGPSEIRRLAASVEAMRERLLRERSLAARRSLLTGQEEERRRLAMGIHDDSVQAVLAASLRLQRLRRQLRASDPETVTLVHHVQADLEEAISRLRRMIFELHPPTLDRDGLEAAMRLYLAETFDPAGVTWSLERSGEVPDDPVTTSLVYRLFREAALNVLRHSAAEHVDVRLEADAEEVRVEIVDDGVGFDPSAERVPVPGHLGLLSSRQLCEAAGGRWKVDSAPGHGTTVRYGVPVGVP